jgi:ketosteroid isomerase-like protein
MSAAEDTLREAERGLQSAMLAGDVATLDQLLDDRVIATGPDGRRFTKSDDLELHRSGTLVIHHLAEEELSTIVAGDTGVTLVLLTLTGTQDGHEFRARLRYTRAWTRHDNGRWRVLAAHVSPHDGS